MCGISGNAASAIVETTTIAPSAAAASAINFVSIEAALTFCVVRRACCAWRMRRVLTCGETYRVREVATKINADKQHGESALRCLRTL